MPSSSHIFRCIRPSGQLEPEDQRQPQSEEQTIPGEPLAPVLALNTSPSTESSHLQQQYAYSPISSPDPSDHVNPPSVSPSSTRSAYSADIHTSIELQSNTTSSHKSVGQQTPIDPDSPMPPLSSRSMTSLHDGSFSRLRRKEVGSASRRGDHVSPTKRSMTPLQEHRIETSSAYPISTKYPPATTSHQLHDHSSSSPCDWKDNPFGDAMLGSVTGPSLIHTSSNTNTANTVPATVTPSTASTLAPFRPELPKLKIDQYPNKRPSLPSFPSSSPPPTAYSPPTSTASVFQKFSDIPPAVPPKNMSRSGRVSPTTKLSPYVRKYSAVGLRSPTPTGTNFAEIRSLSQSPSAQSIIHQQHTLQRQQSQQQQQQQQPIEAQTPTRPPRRKLSGDHSAQDRGRDLRRPSSRSDRQDGQSMTYSITISDAPNDTQPHHSGVPYGLPVSQAMGRYTEAERQSLRTQALRQAERFELLTTRHVSTLSKELQSLDGRCDYLRSTHKALRAGRHKLHGRLVNYLHRSGENGVFSRESLLRQEETLADLDHSIDDWYGKLELAESRRMRVRQKLLEHVAAAATLAPSPELEPLQQKPDQLMPMVFKVPLKATASPVTPPAVNDLSFFPSSREMCASRPATATRLPVTATQQLTPPGTPEQGGSPTRHARQDIESIQIFADGNVLGIFDSIERAIGNMTDAEYEMC